MITITKEFTKEQLQQIIETDHVQCGEASSLARTAPFISSKRRLLARSSWANMTIADATRMQGWRA